MYILLILCLFSFLFTSSLLVFLRELWLIPRPLITCKNMKRAGGARDCIPGSRMSTTSQKYWIRLDIIWDFLIIAPTLYLSCSTVTQTCLIPATAIISSPCAVVWLSLRAFLHFQLFVFLVLFSWSCKCHLQYKSHMLWYDQESNSIQMQAHSPVCCLERHLMQQCRVWNVYTTLTTFIVPVAFTVCFQHYALLLSLVMPYPCLTVL